MYQAILCFDNRAIPFGDPAANYFEPLLAHFNKLMLVYQVKKQEYEQDFASRCLMKRLSNFTATYKKITL